jgi:hypothetical protein
LTCAAILAACGSSNPTPSQRSADEAIRTLPSSAPDAPCLLALSGGPLVVDSVSGLGFLDPAGRPVHVSWPFGYSARWDGDRLALVDPHAQIVARVGDVVRMTGGYGPADEWWTVCHSQPITVLSTPSP